MYGQQIDCSEPFLSFYCERCEHDMSDAVNLKTMDLSCPLCGRALTQLTSEEILHSKECVKIVNPYFVSGVPLWAPLTAIVLMWLTVALVLFLRYCSY